MRLSSDSHSNGAIKAPSRWCRVGLSGFLFFLVKGLLWLLAPAWLALR